MRGKALRFQPGLREHHMRFNVDHHTRRKFAVALATLTEHNESALIALAQVIGGDGDVASTVLQHMKAALRLLVEGPEGRFK